MIDFWPFFDNVFLLSLWKCTAKLAWPIMLKLSGSSKGWIWGLYSNFRPDLTPMADFTLRQMLKMTTKIRNTYFYCHFENVQPMYVLRIFLAIFGLNRPLKSAISVRSGQNFKNSPQIHPFDDPENFSMMGLASLTVHFQSGNKNTYYVFLLPFSAFIGLYNRP